MVSRAMQAAGKTLIFAALALLLPITARAATLSEEHDEETPPAQIPTLPRAVAETTPGAPRVPPRVRVTWVESAPELDGRFDDPAWRDAPVLTGFHQASPDTGAPASQRTEVRIITDGESLFVAVRLWDSDPEEIVARRMLRDDFLYYDDRFNIVLDTFHDHRNGYFFQISANGSRRDGLIEGPLFEGNWDAIWAGEVRRDAEGWQAEIEIPFRSLSFDPRSDTWGMNLERGIRRRDEISRWADPFPQRSVINMARSGVLAGMRGISQGVGLDVVPGVTTRFVRDPFDRGRNLFEPDTRSYWRSDPTLDVFYKLTTGLTATATVNTDFGETEVDERQVNLDRFALFFPEKRDFFLQDGLIFNFADLDQNARPFFSRRIGIAADGEPSKLRAGAKLTGRAGPLKIGLLNAQVEGHHVTDVVPDGTGRLQAFRSRNVRSTNVTVARIAANVLDESTLGAIATYGDPRTNDDNWLVGTDFNYRKSDVFGDQVVAGRAYYMHTDTHPACDPTRSAGDCDAATVRSGAKGGGDAYGFRLQYPNDRVFWQLGMDSVSDDFNPALGFVNRSGIRSYDGLYRRRWRPDDDEFWRTVEWQADGALVTDFDDTVETGRLQLVPLRITTDIAGTLEFRYQHRYEFIRRAFPISSATVTAGRYHFDEGTIRAASSFNRPLRAEWELTAGSFFGGQRLRILTSVDWRPSDHWLFSVQLDDNKLWLPGRDARTRIVRVRVNVQFTPHIAWLTFAQYDNVSDSVGVNSRLRWIVSDGREFFLVLNQGVREIGGSLETGRSEALAKAGWTFRF